MLKNQYITRLSNYCLKHKRRVVVATCFSGVYLYFALYTRNYCLNETVKMGMAGSLTNVVCEVMFHSVDTVNIRSKVFKGNVSTMNMLSRIYYKEGLYGFIKGITATFYGSIFCGFVYFGAYKYLKDIFKQYFDESRQFLTYFLASFFAELMTLTIYYPYDLVKSRLQTSNSFYQYKNLIHAFHKIVSTENFFSLYKGSLSYLITYTLYISMQFTIYEVIIDYLKKAKEEKLEKMLIDEDIVINNQIIVNDYSSIFYASLFSGAISSALTNGFEIVTVKKQTSPEISVSQILREEKYNLLTKGIGARVYYHSIQSIFLFTLLSYMGKQFDVDLSD